jgi:hypothetical protein
MSAPNYQKSKQILQGLVQGIDPEKGPFSGHGSEPS